MELQGRVAQLRRQGFGLASITYDPVAVLADFSARRGITFPLLSDPGSTTIKRYGILNTTVPHTNSLFGYPFPGTFVLNRKGVVIARVFEPAYQERKTVSSLLAGLGRQVDAPVLKTTAPHLQILSYLTDQVAAPGTHFSIVLDVTPDRHVHVYAPGANGYRPVSLTVESQPALVLRESHLPKPEDYFFRPLKEHVAVFQKPFRLVQDVTIDPSPAAAVALKDAQAMTLRATLNYQACDDRVCFNPQSVPLSWTVNLRRLDTERVKRP